MSRAFFEDFGSTPAPQPEAVEPMIDANALRESYEAGYKAGQENGVVGAEADKTKLTADISQALEEAGFSYFEARQHVLNSMRPLLEVIFDVVLPDMAQDGLPQFAIEELLKVAKQIDTPIRMACAPEVLAELTALASQHVNFPLEIDDDESLTSKQIELHYDKGISQIDMEQTTAKIRRMSADFFSRTQEGNVQDG